MKKNVKLSNSREIPLLLFLWRWKVSTTAALIKKFFPNCAGKTAYNRILALRQAGLIRVRSDGIGQEFVCTLDIDGFKAIRQYLPYLKEEGFKSEELGHDLLVSAFHLGDWLIEKPKDASLFSEQELRRTNPELMPSWVPNSEVHRPDGYTQISIGGNHVTLAIEVELSQKRDSDYLRIAEFYDHFQKIHRVLWLVPGEAMAKNLNSKMMAALSSRPSPHNFILFEEFKQLGWESKISIGPDQGRTLTNLLSESSPNAEVNLPKVSLVHSLLDTRKSPHVATAYRGYEVGAFRD